MGKKPKFVYQLQALGPCCRTAWILAAGYVNKNNSRVRSLEAQIRKGVKNKTSKHNSTRHYKKSIATRTALCKAFIIGYVLNHSQFSPVDLQCEIDFCGMRELYQRYQDKCLKGCRKKIKFHYFERLWREVMETGVTDPETSVHYKCNVRKSRAKGFKKCNTCQYWKNKRDGSGDATKRAFYQTKLDRHIADVDDDRAELARIVYLCSSNEKHVGFYIDAADVGKFQIPTTKSTAKMLSSLWRVRQKLTCVKMFATNDLLVFRTLAHVPAGANLTATILCRVFALGYLNLATHLYINFDGSGDNVNYTLVYVLVHLLLCCFGSGWPLRNITILRFKVGHTHNELDAIFGLVSIWIYGKHACGDSRKNILSFTSFKTMVGNILSRYVKEFEDIHAAYDFDSFVKGYRPSAADTGIQRHFSIQFQLRSDPTPQVYVRSKPAVGAKTLWSDWTQLYPSPLTVEVPTPHLPTVTPLVAANKETPEFQEKVVPTLKSFYDGSMKHGIKIPREDREEMLHYLEHGPGNGPETPPTWINWSDNQTTTATTGDDDESSSSSVSDEEDTDGPYVPFAHIPKNKNGKKCRCGSDTHLTTNHSACPLNKKRRRTTPSEDDSDSDESNTTFPYPVGTRVAMSFESGVFAGEITQLYDDDPTIAMVTFTDGDKKDLDVEETQYAVELYKQDFES